MTNAQNAKDFELRLNTAVLETQEKIEDAVQVIAMDTLRGVVLKSPVDTGRFRGNWIVSLNSPSMEQTPRTDASGSATINKAISAIESYDVETTSRIYIQNNLPYGNKLENGSSQQAPEGMVSVTINEINVAHREILL